MAKQPEPPNQFEMLYGWSPVNRPLPAKHWRKIRESLEPFLTDPHTLDAIRDTIASSVSDYGCLVEIGVTERLAPWEETKRHLDCFRLAALKLAEALNSMSEESRQRLSVEIDTPHAEPRLPADLRTPSEELSLVLGSLPSYLGDLADFASLAARRAEHEIRRRPAKDPAADEIGIKCRAIWVRHTTEPIRVLNRGGPSAWERFLGAVLEAAGAEVTPRTVTERLARYANDG